MSSNKNSVECVITLGISATAMAISLIDAGVKIPMVKEFYQSMGYLPKKMATSALVDIAILSASAFLTGKYAARLLKYLELFEDRDD